MTWNSAKKKVGRIFYWLLFSVLFGSLPVGFTAADAAYHHQTLSLAALIGKGELLLIASGLAGASLGEVLYGDSKRKALKASIVILALSVVAISSYIFGIISEDLRNKAEPSQFGVTLSLWTFGISLVIGITTILFSEDGSV